jgi:membrane protein implicated in regulation of membrane protease activity
MNVIPLLWLAGGALLIIAEALTAPGIGIFLAGLGGMMTALLIEAGWIGEKAFLAQCTSFFAFTCLWTLLLWRPLKRLRHGKIQAPGRTYHNMIGTQAVVASGGLTRGQAGYVAWSGTLMNAVIDSGSKLDSLPEGAQVTIVSILGNTLSVIPASIS